MNYQVLLDELLEKEEIKGKRLLLHSCCAPCSSYVLSYLSNYFRITVFYYNPNIEPKEEFEKRALEQQKLLSLMDFKYDVDFIIGDYDNNLFHEEVKGLEDLKEGGKRCYACYKQRLKKTAMLAQKLSYDFFCTTLSVSPYKNAVFINEIGKSLEDIYHVCFLPSDFKKKEGYKKSIAYSKEYGLYRQDYCGCIYSKKENDENEGKNH